jgi:predicted NAD-dependent protein-ADP-ribosyltransferase YbiA (DUF1768 family)
MDAPIIDRQYSVINEDQATVVHIKKKGNGETKQDCDVYIGPAISNPHWELKKSIWSNDFGKSSDKLTLYRDHILSTPTLLRQLEDLRFKTLGCWHAPLPCHGDVLRDLLNDHYRTLAYDDPLLNNAHVSIHYFKGSACPWSNLFASRLHFKNRQFHCVQQYLAHERAREVGDHNTAELLRNSRNSADSLDLEMSNFYQKPIPFSKRGSIRMMEYALNAKYKQCPLFRDYCERHAHCIPVETTRSNFWGMGKVRPDLRDQRPDFDEMPGLNILGWIILKVIARNKFQGDFSRLNSLYAKLPDGCSPKKGMHLVMYGTSDYSETAATA